MKQIRAELRRLKAQLDAFGPSRTPERMAVFARYCEAQKRLGQLELQSLTR